MITYRISGTLPASWEDFFSLDSRYPHITIVTRAELDDCDFDDDGTPDGWLDIVVDTDVICLDVARLAIADALGIDNPENIVIDARGVCQAV